MAHWDGDAKVWWAQSDDVKGLVAEADTIEALVDDLTHLVPELLELNHQIVAGRNAIKISVIANRIEEVLVTA